MDIKRGPKSSVSLSNTPIDVTLDEPINVQIVEPADPVTKSIPIINHAHLEVHDGEHYTFSANNGDLDEDGLLEFLITTPDTIKYAHVVATVYGALHTRFSIYEDSTHTAGATQAYYNNNRNSSNTSGIVISANAGGGADGTLIFSTEFGISTGVGTATRSGGGASRADSEWVLKQNSKYIYRVMSLADANVVNIVIAWYDHNVA